MCRERLKRHSKKVPDTFNYPLDGIDFPASKEPVKTMFVLAGSKDERNYHLRALMAIAQIAQDKHFESRWLNARDTEAIRNLILLSTRTRDELGKKPPS